MPSHFQEIKKWNIIKSFIDSFYPTDKPISLHRLRCSPLAVVHYSCVSHCLAATAISARK